MLKLNIKQIVNCKGKFKYAPALTLFNLTLLAIEEASLISFGKKNNRKKIKNGERRREQHNPQVISANFTYSKIILKYIPRL